MIREAIQLVDAARTAHRSIIDALHYLQLQQQRVNLLEQADCEYAIREASKLLDDARKACDQQFQREELRIVQQFAQQDNPDESINTPYCRATPDMLQMVAPPRAHKEPEQYHALMDALAIDPQLRDYGKELNELGEFDTEVVKLNWSGFQWYCARLAAAGLPLPAGIDPNKIYSRPVVRIVKRAEIPTLLDSAEEHPF